MKFARYSVIHFFICFFFFYACSNNQKTSVMKTKDSLTTSLKIEKSIFGKLKDGREINLFSLTNKNGINIKIINFGGIVTSILVPDKNNNFSDIVLGFDSIENYEKPHPYFGCIVGRYANRIANAKFTLEGKEYKLSVNNGINTIHGGNEGFDKKVWNTEIIKDSVFAGLKLNYLSKDGEEGYPGNLNVTVIYKLTNDNELIIEYEATTDKATPVNLTHHSYFNFTGYCKTSVLNHEIKINSEKYVAVNENLIPTGELPELTKTSMDFTSSHKIGERIAQVKGGYDHTYVLKKTQNKPELAATVYEPESGRYLEVFTTEPGVQFYTGNFLDGTVVGKKGKKYEKHDGFCLEAQHFPDSPNQLKFPNTILKPNETYLQTTIYKFSIKQ